MQTGLPPGRQDLYGGVGLLRNTTCVLAIIVAFNRTLPRFKFRRRPAAVPR